MDGTVLQQGRFVVASGAAGAVPLQYIEIPANADFMWVKNYTQQAAAGSVALAGYDFYWQRGMAAGTGLVRYKGNGLLTANDDVLETGGFTLYDPSGQSAGALPLVGAGVAATGITNATRPVVATGSTAGLIASRSVVRLSLATGQTAIASDVLGIDWVIDTIVANTSFRISPLLASTGTPGITTGTLTYRIVNYDPLFYPRRRYVTAITKAVNAQVTTNVFHQLTPGQAVRFNIPQQSGMIELNSNSQNNYAYATVVSVVDELNFTIDIDTTAFTTFTWPTVAQVNAGSQFPQMEPFGENTAVSITSLNAQTPLVYSSVGPQVHASQTGLLADATVNTGYLGMLLGTGGNATAVGANVSGPAGYAANDVIYWVAGKSAFGGL